MNTQEQDYKALRFCVERSHGTALSKSRFLKKLEKNWKSGRVQPDRADGAWKKALCCARILMGDFSRWDGWEYRSDYAANCWINRPLPIPMWDGGLTEHLFILAEEGIGDEVLFMSLLPEALCRARKVTVECDPRLESVLKRSFPRTETVPRLGTLTKIREWLTSASNAESPCQDPGCSPKTAPSAWLLMGDLARYFRLDKSHFPGKPYLRPDPERLRQMESFRGRVGISWSGNHGSYPPQQLLTLASRMANGTANTFRRTGPDGLTEPTERTRSSVPPTFIPPNATPLNLQYDQTHPLAAEPGIDLKNDVEGLFALCSVLSRVVTVSTSIAHIAGSVGCPVDVIHALPGSGGKNDQDILNWKWPEGKTPWYGSARVFRNLKHYEMCR